MAEPVVEVWSPPPVRILKNIPIDCVVQTIRGGMIRLPNDIRQMMGQSGPASEPVLRVRIKGVVQVLDAPVVTRRTRRTKNKTSPPKQNVDDILGG